MTNTVLLWLLVAVLLAAMLAVAAVLRARNSRDVPEPAAVPVDQPAAVPLFDAADGVAPGDPTPPSGMVAPTPGDPAATGAANPAMAALDPRTPIRGVGALAADVLVDTLRRPGPFTGSVLPSGDGSSASDPAYRIKASTATRRFYAPESPQYPHVRAELWFRTATDAERAGFTVAREHP